MGCDYSELLTESKTWARAGVESGWFREEDVKPVRNIKADAPGSLFQGTERRPLVVAFFGGTGVGKSSLLNRLSGQAIARTGVERPTSREVSVYIFESIEIGRMPADFPVDQARIARHDNADMKHIMWIDMPDIDSTESTNRQIVLDWIPHVDVLLYVVSPERYKDQKGWELLRAVGARHAWIFIMNQKDRAEAGQIDAFRVQLSAAGFRDPVLLATDCRRGIQPDTNDDFDQLTGIIRQLSEAQLVDQLERYNQLKRIQELSHTMTTALQCLGATDADSRLLERWAVIWLDAADNLEKGLEWPIQLVSKNYAASPSGALSGLRKKPDESSDTRTDTVLWDEWAQTLLDDALNQLIVSAGADTLRVSPLKTELEPQRQRASTTLHTQAEQALRHSLANPGSGMRRLLLKLSNLCIFVLPLASISWVAYELFERFYEGSQIGKPYLGSNFAIHSTLLIAVSWLLPWFINKKLKPSLERVALSALKSGSEIGLERIQSDVEDCIVRVFDRRNRYIDRGRALIQRCSIEDGDELISEDSILGRTLTRQQDPDRARVRN